MPQISNFYILSIDQRDIPKISDIEQRCYKKPWSYDNLLIEIQNSDNINLCIKNESNIILGYLFGKRVYEELFINNFCINPEFQNQKIGSYFFKEYLALLKKSNIKKIFLEVRESNIAAIKIYKTNNFVEDGKRNNFYDDGESAILMHLNYL